ncbi:MAG: AAA family ATPase, partial [Gemmatimonadetes bacterium]|nr:AAA family ATPase [Gemmatimonadota bacterium]
TPDLMPSDVVGTNVLDPRSGEFRLHRGPVFTEFLLADEVNRTPPKTQAALLEAMEERHVTLDGERHPLSPELFVVATQNPIELEGTYPLPEAQLDRFMFKIHMEHLPEEHELEVVRTTTRVMDLDFDPVVTGPDLVAFQSLVRGVPVAEPVLRYALGLVRATRPAPDGGLDFVRRWVSYGASVRAAQYLVLGAKARALTLGRYHVTFEDIRALAQPVLRHRVLTNFHAESEGVTPDQIVGKLLESVPQPRSEM